MISRDYPKMQAGQSSSLVNACGPDGKEGPSTHVHFTPKHVGCLASTRLETSRARCLDCLVILNMTVAVRPGCISPRSLWRRTLAGTMYTTHYLSIGLAGSYCPLPFGASALFRPVELVELVYLGELGAWVVEVGERSGAYTWENRRHGDRRPSGPRAYGPCVAMSRG